MISVESITDLVNQKIGEGPLFIVDVQVHSGNKIVVEMDGDNGVGIDDCVAISRQIEGNLDREVEDFELKVTSAGLGQPLKVERQLKKNLGKEVRLSLNDGTEASGKLISADDEEIKLLLAPSKKKKLPEREAVFRKEEIKETKVRISFK